MRINEAEWEKMASIFSKYPKIQKPYSKIRCYDINFLPIKQIKSQPSNLQPFRSYLTKDYQSRQVLNIISQCQERLHLQTPHK